VPDGVTTPSKAQGESRWRQFAVKKDGVTFVNTPHKFIAKLGSAYLDFLKQKFMI
jgi:hypothetical protein